MTPLDEPARADADGPDCDAVVLGGGLFGCWAALHLARRGLRVTLLEREAALLQRASYNNQARVHTGYHYPRSILTGLRSRLNAARFRAEFADCIDARFAMHYAVARGGTNVTAGQFVAFCRRIGAPLAAPRPEVARLFDRERIEAVFAVEECAFDARALGRRLALALVDAGVTVRLGCEAERVHTQGARITVEARAASGPGLELRAPRVVCCAYAGTNRLLAASGLRPIALRHELAELALVDVPGELQHVGVTVVCGPYFSFMPFPPLGCHTLSHVRYTPQSAWSSAADGAPVREPRVGARSQFESMRRDAARYMPLVAQFVQRGSLWETKTILPLNDRDDGRPILFLCDARMRGLTCVVGGKIDNVYDMERELDALLSAEAA